MRLPRPARAGTLILVAVLGLGLSACGGHQANSSESTVLRHTPSAAGIASAAPPKLAQGTPGTAQIGQAVKPAHEDIVVTGQVALRVGRRGVPSAFNHLGTLAGRLGGYLASSELHTVGKAPDAIVTIRVPQSRVNQLLAAISKLGRVTSQHLTGTDVTGTVVDTQAQVTNLKSEEVALRALLSRAGSITQILAVQDQLFAVEGQVQQLSAQQSSLLTRVTYATLSVRITQPRVLAARPGLLDRGWSTAVSNTLSGLRALVLAVAWSAPLWLLGAIGAGFLVLWRRRRRGLAAPSTGPEA